jgi:hypothetical protein
LLRELEGIGFLDVEFCMFATRSNHHHHEFVFATRRAA